MQTEIHFRFHPLGEALQAPRCFPFPHLISLNGLPAIFQLRLIGLWTNAASRDGEPTALFRLFAFHRKAHGLEENLPFLEEIDPRDFPPVEFPELP
jgi:hypothetical protein